jgi:hypothetical protein
MVSFESFTLANILNLLAVGITCIRLFRLIPALDIAFIDVPLDIGRNNSSSLLVCLFSAAAVW